MVIADWTEDEKRLGEHVKRGEILDFDGEAAPHTQAKPVIRAEVIRFLFLGLAEEYPISPSGLRLKGARITGALDVSDVSGLTGDVMPALALRYCDIEQPITLEGARLAALTLRGSRLVGVEGRGIFIASELDITRLQPIDDGGPCYVNIRGGRIFGNVYVDGSEFRSKPPPDPNDAQALSKAELQYDYALRLTECEIGGSVYMEREVVAHGGIVIRNSRISGNVSAKQVRVIPSDGHAFSLQNTELSGAALFDKEFISEGSVCFREARIEGSLHLDGAQIQANREPAQRARRARKALVPGWFRAIDAERVRVMGDVTLGRPEETGNFEADGHRRAVFETTRQTVVRGEISFAGATVDGDFVWSNLDIGRAQTEGANPEAVMNLENATIVGAIWADKLTNQSDARIKLGGAKAAILRDYRPGSDEALLGWGDGNVLIEIDGFHYSLPSEAAPLTRRLEWLDRQFPLAGHNGESKKNIIQRALGWLTPRPGGDREIKAHYYRTQPFSRCATALYEIGMNPEARQVELQSARYMRRSGSRWLWFPRKLVDVFFNYCIAPSRTFITLLAVFLIGWGGVWRANHGGMLELELAPTQSVSIGEEVDEAAGFEIASFPCGDEIHSGLYALDTFVPLIDLRYEPRCEVPDETLPVSAEERVRFMPLGFRSIFGIPVSWEIDAAIGRTTIIPGVWSLPTDEPYFWRWAKAIYELLGWIFISLAILTVTRVLRRGQ